MEQFTGFYWPNIVSANGDERHRSSAAVNEFDFVSATAFVNMHDRPHIPAVEFFMLRVAIQYDKGMFRNHMSSLRIGGYKSRWIVVFNDPNRHCFSRPVVRANHRAACLVFYAEFCHLGIEFVAIACNCQQVFRQKLPFITDVTK